MSRLGNINLFVNHVENSVQFYANVFELTLNPERSVLPHFALLDAGNCTLTLQDGESPEAILGQTGSVEIGFEVEDIDATRKRLIAYGINLDTTQQMGWGRGFSVTDPDGHRLTVYQMFEEHIS